MNKRIVNTDRARIFLSPPHMSGEELVLVQEAFSSNYIAPAGPMIHAFERAFCEISKFSHAAAVSSGTAAMHLALRVLGISPGDSVIASTLTFIGSITPAVFLGAVPVFIDADPGTWNMDPNLLETEIERCARDGRLPKAVIPTDLYGQCADLDRILEICIPRGIPVVVDAAEAVGARYKGRWAGKGATAAVFSFNGNKIITTSGGGMLASDDGAFIEKARYLSQQARDPFVHYEHREIGYNYRMSNILAAIGCGQLRVIDQRVSQKRAVFDAYRKALGDVPGIAFMPEAHYGRSNRWLTCITIDPNRFGADRETVRLALEAENIEARPVWKPMHLQPVFDVTGEGEEGANADGRRVATRVVGGAVSEALFRSGLCLPSGSAMSEEDLDRIIKVVLTCPSRRG